jgi:hypothetical protein
VTEPIDSITLHSSPDMAKSEPAAVPLDVTDGVFVGGYSRAMAGTGVPLAEAMMISARR